MLHLLLWYNVLFLMPGLNDSQIISGILERECNLTLLQSELTVYDLAETATDAIMTVLECVNPRF